MASSTTLLFRKVIRKRPITTLALTSSSFVVGSAFGLEFYAHRQEEQWNQRTSAATTTASSSSSSALAREDKKDSIHLHSSSTPWLLPRVYDRQQIRTYWLQRPVTIVLRLWEILWELSPVLGRYAVERELLYYFPSVYASHFVTSSPTSTTATTHDQPPQDSSLNLELSSSNQETTHQQSPLAELHIRTAIRFREALTNLGPAWIKGGQQLAIRPDLVPPIVLEELQRLCDSVRPIPDDVALALLQKELLSLQYNHQSPPQKQEHPSNSHPPLNLTDVFTNVHLVASASLGQVYQAKLVESGELVAIKVQRPGMRRSFSLDLFLLQLCGHCADVFTSVFTKQTPTQFSALIDAFSHGSYSELDYENEARNQKHFQQELKARGCKVKVPNVYDEYTTERVLTSEWIQGVKLTDSSPEKIRELIPVGVELFLTQLFDIGAFHADPHPGNLLVTDDDKESVLCLLDFGLTTEVSPQQRHAMTKAVVHLLYRDFDRLIMEDTKELGFLPPEFDTSELQPILKKVLTGGILESSSNLHQRKRKFQEISNELNEIFYRYPFHIPPFFALVTRGLGLLEGIALTDDPEFDIFRASAPFATKRAFDLMGRQFVATSTVSRNSL